MTVTPAMFPQTPTQAVVPSLWPGSTVVVIGGGSSLTPEDVNYVRGEARVVAVKEAYLLAPWADVLYAADYSWWKFYGGAPTFTGLKYAIEQGPDVPPVDWSAWPDVQVLRNTGTEGLELEPSGLRTGFNSGFQGVGLAYHFGAARIILLGFDMWSGPDGPNWFTSTRHHNSSPYPLFIQAFSSLVEPLKVAGVAVVNASRFTVLSVFPRLTIQEALAA